MVNIRQSIFPPAIAWSLVSLWPFRHAYIVINTIKNSAFIRCYSKQVTHSEEIWVVTKVSLLNQLPTQICWLWKKCSWSFLENVKKMFWLQTAKKRKERVSVFQKFVYHKLTKYFCHLKSKFDYQMPNAMKCLEMPKRLAFQVKSKWT